MRTHYDNLNVSEKAGPEVIRAAYKALSQKWHPDKHPDQREKAERYFKIISRAFELLSDPKTRAEYDAWLAKQRSPAEPIPEVDPVNEPPKQSQPQKNMAEAWEDGQRSKQQGLTANDCPYSGELAEAWQKGFIADQVPPAAKNSWFTRLWRGEEGLGKTFWLYGVIGSHVVFIAAFFLSFAASDNRDDLPAIIRTTLVIYGAYFIFIWACIWKSAGKIRPMSFWAISARAICLSPLLGIALAIIIPATAELNKKTTSSKASAPIIAPEIPKKPQAPAGEAISPSTQPSLSAEEIHSQKIYAAHPDAASISEDPAFWEWASKDSETNRIAENGTADEVIALFRAYKSHRANQRTATLPIAIAPINQYPDCVIRPTMTDADYRACGITPPGQ